MQAIHLSTAQAMMARPDAIDLDVWKSDGSIIQLRNCISLKYNFYAGTRTIKLLTSIQLRTIRDCCIIRINGLEVFM